MLMKFSAMLLLALTPAWSLATIVQSDDFSTNGALLGTTPDVGGNWTITGTSVVNPLTVSGNALSLLPTGQDASSAFSASVPNTAGTSLFSGLDINLSAAQTGDYFFHVSDPVGTTSLFFQRLYARSTTGGYQLGFASNSGTGSVITYSPNVYTFGTTSRVVIAWNFVSGTANDTFDVFVNPTNPVPGGNTPIIAGYTWTGNPEPASTLSAANFRQGGSTAGPTLSADNLIVATTFAEAAQLSVAVPEPSAFLFGGLVSLIAGGAVCRRRML